MQRSLLLLALLAACKTPEPSATKSPTTAAPVIAPEKAPPSARAQFDEALALRQAGDDTGALAKLDAVLQQAPTFALAALERAELRVNAGNAAQAGPDAELAASALPDNPRAQRVLGQVREERGDLAGAVGAYEKSLEMKDDPALRRRVASLAGRAGRTDDAVRLWEALREKDPSDLGAHMELAALYEKQDRAASAEKEYEAVVALAPANPALHRRFADFLEREGKAAKARAERQTAEAIAPAAHDERRMRALQPSSR